MLGLDFYIRLPESIPNSRLATLSRPSLLGMLFGFPMRLAIDTLNRRSNIYRALEPTPVPQYLKTRSIFTRAILRFQLEAVSEPLGLLRTLMASLQPMDANSGYDKRH